MKYIFVFILLCDLKKQNKPKPCIALNVVQFQCLYRFRVGGGDVLLMILLYLQMVEKQKKKEDIGTGQDSISYESTLNWYKA